MDTIIYQPNPGRTAMRKVFGGIVIAFGVILGCTFLGASPLILPLMLNQSDGAAPGTWLFGLMFPCGGLLFLVVFIVVGVLIFRGSGPEQLELSSHAVSHTQGKTTTSLLLNEITHLRGQWRMGQKHGHWELVIADFSGQTIELGIPQRGYLATFEVMPILQELLPRLPDTVEIDDRVQGYLDTGRMTR